MDGNGTQPFKRRERIRLDELGEDMPNHTWTFWQSPIPEVWAKLYGLVRHYESIESGETRSDEEYQLMEKAFCEGVAEIVLDTGESRIDLSTADAVHNAFFDGRYDIDLLSTILVRYMEHVKNRLEEKQKKVSARSAATAGNSAKSRQATKFRRSS